MDRCPHCRAPLPGAKTCARPACGAEFYRGEGGRTDAVYCSARCAAAERKRRQRERAHDVTASASATP
jgi:hypothetical protein